MVTISRFDCTDEKVVGILLLNCAFKYDRAGRKTHIAGTFRPCSGKKTVDTTPGSFILQLSAKEQHNQEWQKKLSQRPVRFEQLLLADTLWFRPGSSPDKAIALSQPRGPCSVRSPEQRSSFRIKRWTSQPIKKKKGVISSSCWAQAATTQHKIWFLYVTLYLHRLQKVENNYHLTWISFLGHETMAANVSVQMKL